MMREAIKITYKTAGKKKNNSKVLSIEDLTRFVIEAAAEREKAKKEEEKTVLEKLEEERKILDEKKKIRDLKKELLGEEEK